MLSGSAIWQPSARNISPGSGRFGWWASSSSVEWLPTNESFESGNKLERLCHCHRKMNFKQDASAYVDFEASEIEC